MRGSANYYIHFRLDLGFHILSPRRLVRFDELAFTGLIRITLFSPFVTPFRLLDLMKHVFVLTHRRELILFSLLVYRQSRFKHQREFSRSFFISLIPMGYRFFSSSPDSNPRFVRDRMFILMLKLYITIMYNIRYTLSDSYIELNV